MGGETTYQDLNFHRPETTSSAGLKSKPVLARRSNKTTDIFAGASRK
jgi:hypothetical protein